MSAAYPSWGENTVPVVVVDDARFTLEMLRRVLHGTGFTDILVAASAREALDLLRQRPADVLVADWLMPDVDGLALTKQVRRMDAETSHYTFILLLTAREGAGSLDQAFASGVDDFVSKSPDSQELLARIQAAGRIARLQNDLLAAGRELAELRQQGTDDKSLASGLGNRGYVEEQLDRLLRHVQARGGSACVALVRLNDPETLAARHGDPVVAEVLDAMGRRLVQSVRPLDRIGTTDGRTFAVLMHHEAPDGCHPNTFRRVERAVNLRAYDTTAGFVNATAAMVLCSLDQKAAAVRPEPAAILAMAAEWLDEARAAGRILAAPWSAE